MPNRQPALRQTPADLQAPSRALAAKLITCALAVLVPCMVALIGYRSIMIHGPSTAVVIDGDPSLDGATISVIESVEPHRRWTTTLDRSNEWQSPILLDPGVYHVTVMHQGKSILNEDFSPDQYHGVRDELPSMVAIVGNSTFADATIEIVKIHDNAHLTRPISVKLTADGHFRTVVYLMAGDYRAVARMIGTNQILAQTEFSVDQFDRNSPRISRPRVDLTKAKSAMDE